MSSELRVNKLTSRSGVGTVTFNDSGLIITGIATAATLDITGNATIAGVLSYDDVTNIDSVGIITAQNDVVIADKIIHLGDTNTAIRFPAADTITAETGGSERLRIDSSGRLLLGTTTEGETSADDLTIASAGTAGVTIRSGTTDRGNIYFSDGTSGNDEFRGYIQYDHSDNYLRLATNAVERLRIDSSGNIGIGEINPGAKLHVEGDTNDTSPGSTALVRFESTGAGTDTGIRFKSGTSSYTQIGGIGGDLYAYAGGQERLRLDSNGRLLVGTSSARSNFYNTGTISALLQTEGAASAGDPASRFVSQTYGRSNSDGPIHILAKHRGTSVGGTTVVANNDQLGILSFQGSDGAQFVEGASITARVDGTPGANDMPGRLVFSTTADGASSPTERMRIDNTGKTKFTPSTSSATLQIEQGTVNSDSIRLQAGGTTSTYLEYRGYLGHAWFVNTTERMRIDSSGRMGLGTQSPSYLLDVDSAVIQVGNSTDAFVQYKSTAGNWHAGANSANAFAIYSGTYGSGNERMRIDSSGNLQLSGSTDQRIRLNTSGAGGNDSVHIRGDGNALKYNTAAGTTGIHIFENNGNELMRIQPGGGLTFNGDTSQDNALDDYEEGTWTPTLPNGGTVSTVHNASYTKVGRLVTANFYITVSGIPNNSNQTRIGGLPYNSGASNHYGAGQIVYSQTFDISVWRPLVLHNGNYIYFHRVDGSSDNLINSNCSGLSKLIIQVSYFTAT